MNPSLRMRVAEAGAPHMVAFFEAFCDSAPEWPDAAAAKPYVEDLVDALLDCLVESAVEWDDLAARDVEDPPQRDNPPWAGNYIAVLRDEKS